MSPFSWHPHPDVWLLIVGLATAYVVAARRHPPTRRQATWFTLGLVATWFAADWPVHDLAEGSLYSVHMLQHLVLTLVAPALLLLGLPEGMLRVLLRRRAVRAAFAFLTRPLIALIVFNSVLVATHWPVLVEASVSSELVHLAQHTVLVGSAIVMWWPVVSPLPELPRLSTPGRMLFLMAQSFVPTVPASFLTFGDRPLYRVYEAFARPWGISALTDQRSAGLIMKLAGGAILWGVIAVLFFRWYAEESDGWDALKFRDVEHDVRSKMIGTGTHR